MVTTTTSGSSPILRRVVQAVLGLLLIALLIWGFRAYTLSRATKAAGQAAGAKGQEDRTVPVVAATVEKRDLPIFLEGLGTVAAFNTVTMKSQVDGRLDEVLFREGQDVKKGDLLARIDSRPFAIELQQAQAALARDAATAKNARGTLERLTSLIQNGLATQQQVDDQRMMLGQAEGNLSADQAQIANAQLQLDYARIKSPIDGVTGVRQVDAGNVVHPNDQNGIVVITQLNPIAVFFTLPEENLARVSKELAQGEVTVEALGGENATKLGEGRVVLIDNQINSTTATIRLKAIFPNADRQLWPNQFVKARMLLRTQKDALVIPAEAVQRGPKGTMVYVIGADDTVKPRPVEIDSNQGDVAIVKSGLEAGERVVSEGQNQLKPGSRVSTKGAGGAASGSTRASESAAEAGSAAPKGSATPSPRPAGSERTGHPRP